MVRCHHIHSETLRGVLAEFLGTFVFGSFVMGSSAQNTFSNNPNTLQANLASGIGLMVGIYISGGVSEMNETIVVSKLSILYQTAINYKLPGTYQTTGIILKVYATFFFCGGILAIIDSNSTVSSPNMAPLAIGLLLTAVVSSYGLNGGPAVNPALDLGPRIVLLLAGWGVEPFTSEHRNRPYHKLPNFYGKYMDPWNHRE
ncbi:aquaporin-8 isoform X2 [Octopus vulgaris]|uniref:Aquaporin-8 isoform X2 n=1 Tax=Octopus vulgaris TaxID=6645 RepID=A0AA36B4M0_OCTVU|nr:aquaporin-8 isoform X2 [Octopus vulgaris]